GLNDHVLYVVQRPRFEQDRALQADLSDTVKQRRQAQVVVVHPQAACKFASEIYDPKSVSLKRDELLLVHPGQIGDESNDPVEVAQKYHLARLGFPFFWLRSCLRYRHG